MAKRLDDPMTRRRALSMLRQGIATQAEIAELAGVTRQAVAYWCQSAGIDAVKARVDRLNREWRRAGERPQLGQGKGPR